jgi:hypothetical protein
LFLLRENDQARFNSDNVEFELVSAGRIKAAVC